MDSFNRLKSSMNSLFTKLLMNFSIVIVLFLGFSALTFTYYKQNLHAEIINYNLLNLRKTIDNYETQFNIVKNQALGLYANEQIRLLNAPALDESVQRNMFDLYNAIHRQIQTIVANPMLDMENLFIYFKNPAVAYEKGGGSGDKEMFENYYFSEDYPLSFWREQFAEAKPFQIYPASTFRELSHGAEATDKGRLLPMILRNQFNPDFYIAALINADSLFKASHFSINNKFYIVDDTGRLYFSSHVTDDSPVIPLVGGAETQYVKNDHFYYFYQKGGATGLTYVNVIPIESITSHFLPQYKTLIVLLALFLAISIAASVGLSAKLNNPVKKMVELIRQTAATPLQTNIREFLYINNSLQDVLENNKSIHQLLSEQKTQLLMFSYMNQLNNIPGGDRSEFAFSKKPYRMMLFQLHFKRRDDHSDKPDAQEPADNGKGTSFVKEYIRLTLLRRAAPDSLTLQMTNDQVLALVFLGGWDPVPDILRELLKTLGHDEPFYTMTVCLSPVYSNSSELTSAYEQTLQLLETRKLGEETQVIEQAAASKKAYAPLSGSGRRNLESALSGGNEAESLAIAGRELDQLFKLEASAADYRRFAEEVIDTIVKSSKSANVEASSVLDREALHETIGGLLTHLQYEQFIASLLREAAASFRQKKQSLAQDKTIRFVTDYLRDHYSEDIFVDMLADKLNLTSGYLSSSFKAKMGISLTDYVSQLRVDKAKLLLVDPALKIQDIAERVGYPNVNTFIRVFKKLTGQTPGDYRKTN